MAFENSAEQFRPSEVRQISTAALLPSNDDYQHFFKAIPITGSEPKFLDFGNSDIYNDKSIKLAQDIEVPMPVMPTLVPSPDQLGFTKETTVAAAEVAWQLGTAMSKDHPLAGQEEALMNATTAADPKAWEHACSTFPQLADVTPNLMKAYVRNELAFYSGDDLKQDVAAIAGVDPEFHHFTLGMAQITTKGVQEFEQRYPQFKQFLAEHGYVGHEAQALLDPDCVPMIVAAKTATIVDDLKRHHVPITNETVAYGYNPDVYSYSNGHGGREYKALYDAAVLASHAVHWDQKKEYYGDNRAVLGASEHVKNVLRWAPQE